jgi:hypothetical protein
MKQLICILSIISSINVFSQSLDNNDFKSYIKMLTTDSTSDFYYPRLINKIKNKPSEINMGDCFFLYYGRIFQNGSGLLSLLTNPERPDFDKAAMNGNCRKVIKLGEIMLDRNPVDLTVLTHVQHCIREKGYVDTTAYFEQRFKSLIKRIPRGFASG